MGENDADVKKDANEKKIVDADNTKKVDEGPITIILKLDLHCAGCAKKVKKSVQFIEGVETVKADCANNKLTITGKVDPAHIKERVEFRTKKTVEIISPKPQKDEGGAKKGDEKPPEPKSNNEKPKEPQSTTVVLKISLHCDGCSQKIKRIISKFDGVESVKPDGNKNLVTVKGKMNMKELVPYLKDKLKRNVDVVPPKKEDDKDGEKTATKKVEEGDGKKEKAGDNTGDGKKEKEGDNTVGDKKKSDVEKAVDNSGGDEKKKNNTEKAVDSKEGDEKKKNDEAKAATNESDKKKPDDDAKAIGGGDGGKNKDVINKFEYYSHNPYIYTMPVYNQTYHNQDYGVLGFSTHGYDIEGYANHGYAMEYQHRPLPPPPPMFLHDPRPSETDLFSAENPNACSIM
ncbi:putative heavy metal-associated domain, HMA, heavy metal-associated domain superfamily [Helianthus anomalus]